MVRLPITNGVMEIFPLVFGNLVKGIWYIGLQAIQFKTFRNSQTDLVRSKYSKSTKTELFSHLPKLQY